MKTKDTKKYIYAILLISILFFAMLILNNPTILKKRSNLNANINSKIETSMVNAENNKQEEETIKSEQKNENNEKNNTNQDNIYSDVEESIITNYKGYPVIAKLEIPQIELVTYVISEYSEKALGVSVTKFYGGEPNTVGNFCIAGHNYITKNMFHNLKNLSVGNQIFLTDLENNKKNYTIYSVETVKPNDTQCLSQKTEGRTELTLITCTPDSSKRIIIKAVTI